MPAGFPTRPTEDALEVSWLEAVVLVGFHAGNQVQPHEEVQDAVNCRSGHGDDEPAAGFEQVIKCLGPRLKLTLRDVFEDGEGSCGIKGDGGLRRKILREEAAYQGDAGWCGCTFDKLWVDTDAGGRGELEQHPVVRAEVE